MVGRGLVPASKVRLFFLAWRREEADVGGLVQYGARPWYRHLAALGAVFNILLMMTANLVGFVVGVDGAKEVWGKMVGGAEGASSFPSLLLPTRSYLFEDLRRCMKS
jgi:hypothetical protein